MKLLFLILLLPVMASAQTIHIKDDKADYQGKILVPGASVNDIYSRALSSLKSQIETSSGWKEDASTHTISVNGEIKLGSSTFYSVKTILFAVELTAMDGAYAYHIDSLYLKEHERGGKTDITSSKKLWKQMEESGNVAIGTERVLNEIDMTLQKMLAVLKSGIKLSK